MLWKGDSIPHRHERVSYFAVYDGARQINCSCRNRNRTLGSFKKQDNILFRKRWSSFDLKMFEKSVQVRRRTPPNSLSVFFSLQQTLHLCHRQRHPQHRPEPHRSPQPLFTPPDGPQPPLHRAQAAPAGPQPLASAVRRARPGRRLSDPSAEPENRRPGSRRPS